MTLDPQDSGPLDRDFDISNHVVGIPQIMAEWTDRSARIRNARSDALLDLSYGAHPRMMLDYFPALAGAGTGLLVFIHGGYWRSLDKQVFTFIAEGFDANVAVVTYPLAPQARMGEIVDAIRALPAWLSGNADSLGFDRRHIVICGHSAGGHLAMMLTLSNEKGPKPAAACAIGGLYDLRPVQQAAINREIGLSFEDALNNSPLPLVRDTGFPCLLAAGALESPEFLRQHRILESRWRQTGQDLDTMMIAGANHFSVLDRLIDRAHPLNRWLTERLG